MADSEPSRPEPLPTKKKRWRWLVGCAVLLALAAFLALPTLSSREFLRAQALRRLSEASGREVAFDSLRLGYDLGLRLTKIAILAPSGKPFVTAEAASVQVSLAGLLVGTPLRLALDGPQIHLDRIPPSAPGGSWPSLPFQSIAIADGYLLSDNGKNRLGPIDVAIDLPRPEAEDQLRLEVPKMRLEAPSLDIAGLSRAAADVSFSGSIRRAGEQLLGEGIIVVAQLDARDSESTRQFEKLQLDGTLAGSWSPQEALSLRLDLSVPRGEILWDRFYVDLASHPVQLGAVLEPTDKGFRFSKVDARMKGIGVVKGRGNVRSAGIVDDASFDIDVPDISGLYGIAVRDPFRESYPFLVQTTARGALKTHVEYARVRSSYSVSGSLHLEKGGFSATDSRFEMSGVRVDLPLRLGSNSQVKPVPGSLQIALLSLGDVSLPELTAPLEIRPNRLTLIEPIVLPLLGGTVQLTQFSAEAPLDAPAQASFSLDVEAIELEALTQAVGMPRLRGSMNGAIPRVLVRQGDMRGEGEIRLDLFDGEVIVRDLRIEQLNSSVPTVGFDFDFDDISLEALSKTLDVGKISGIARGGARRLEIVNGQPSQFEAWIENVERSGVKQRISVSAIRKLSILGGSGSDPFSRGVLSFFDEYRYARLGLRCRLENDRFELRGVESKGGSEYLVVGALLPPSVNVVSHQQVISFSEMVRRLQRMTNVSDTSDDQGDSQ